MTTSDIAAIVKATGPAVREYVTKAVAEMTVRLSAIEERIKSIRDGRDGLQGPVGPQGEKGLDGLHGKDGAAGRDGKDGAPGQKGDIGPAGDPGGVGPQGLKGDAGAPGDRGDKGDIGERGPEGPEGKPGRDGRDGQPGAPGTPGEKGIDGLHGKDGKDGSNGIDGLGFDDLDMQYDGERTFSVSFVKGDRTKAFSFTLPIVLDRGVFKEGTPYEKGDATSYGGSMWIAQSATKAVPGRADDDSRAWRLAVKKGRDGKDGLNGKDAAAAVKLGGKA